VLGWTERAPETLEADGHDTSLTRAGENAAGASHPAPHRDPGRAS
jgi:hypothetical protein